MECDVRKKLALAVIKQAFIDIHNREDDFESIKIRTEATTWIEEDRDFNYWCDILGTNAYNLRKALLLSLNNETMYFKLKRLFLLH